MKTKTHQDLCWHLPLLVAVFIQLWPIVFMVSTSLKDMDQIFQATLNPLPLPPTLNNYLTVLGNFPLFTYIYNTFFIAVKNSFFIFKVIIDKGKSCQNTGQHFEYCYERSNEKGIIDISKQRKIA